MMKFLDDNREIPRPQQLSLGFDRTEPDDLKRVMAFLDDRPLLDAPICLSELFTWFSQSTGDRSGGRFVRCVSALFSDRMISCVMNGDMRLSHHSSFFLEDTHGWDRIQVMARRRLSPEALVEVVACCRVFGGMGCPADQDDLSRYLLDSLNRWTSMLASFGRKGRAGGYPGLEDIQFCLEFIQEWGNILDPFERLSFIHRRHAEGVSFFETLSRLKQFYESGALRWDAWRKWLDKFCEFQSTITTDPTISAEFFRLQEILQMAAPWNHLETVDALIERIVPVYERHRDERFARMQQETIQRIDGMIETIVSMLNTAQAPNEVRNAALVDLQKIRRAVDKEMPDSHILKQRDMVEEVFEKAQDIALSCN